MAHFAAFLIGAAAGAALEPFLVERAGRLLARLRNFLAAELAKLAARL